MSQFLSLWLLHLFLVMFSWNSSLPGPTSYILFHLCSLSLAVLESSGPIALAGPWLVVWLLCEELGVNTGLDLRAVSPSRLKGAVQRDLPMFVSFSVYLEEQSGPYLLPQSTLGKVLSLVREKEHWYWFPGELSPKADQWIALFSLTQVTCLLDYHSLHRLRDQSNKGNEGWVIKASTNAYLS